MALHGPLKSVDVQSLPKHVDVVEVEQRWRQRWQDMNAFAYDPRRGRQETFVVDTPPPTVSGSLHMGHIFGYTCTDAIVRFQRMLGKNIYYPMGWDDNGLPTERRVQNYFHVQCDATLPYEPNLRLEQATAEQRKDRARRISRQNFIELCGRLTQDDEKVFMDVWQRMALSVDWRETYATVDDHCRRVAQLSFVDLMRKGHVYSVDAPTMWDVDFQTAVAQAEVEERQVAGAFHDIVFGVDGGEALTLATTRPELLAACVGVTVHPDDPRYRLWVGKHAVTPVFQASVPIFASPLVDPEKGTGVVMVCTFGDRTDVDWWRAERLPLRQILGRDGRFMSVEFGRGIFESRDAARANAAYAELVGKTAKQGREVIVRFLSQTEHHALPLQGRRTDSPLQGTPRAIQHMVKFFEKGDRPLEVIPTRQWFVRLVDKKDALLAAGAKVSWHPEFMAHRFKNWTENLEQDWCISRQRFFGVPFPVWYPLDSQGRAEYERPMVADEGTLPVDPMTATPAGYRPEQRGIPGGFVAESDVFDTWFTSSMTPQIASRWVLDSARHSALFPSDIRPQGHDIIRTWAFYTIAKSMLHEGTAPWKHALINGWILDPDRKKMSKSKGNVVTPAHLIEEHGADAVRYWALSARLGVDTAFDDKVFSVGRRLVTKLFNAGKFVLGFGVERPEVTMALDLSYLSKLSGVVRSVTDRMDAFDGAGALDIIEGFFWKSFTDTGLEFMKGRTRLPATDPRYVSAVSTLRHGFDVLLRLFAPFLPYITDEIRTWGLASNAQPQTIHRARWPGVVDFEGLALPDDSKLFDFAVETFGALNRMKSDMGVGHGQVLQSVELYLPPSDLERWGQIQDDIRSAGRVDEVTLHSQDGEGLRFANAVVRA